MAHLNAAGITRLVTKLKDRFAALAHTHAAATDITGQLPVANGGTGASTASGARTNLDAAQDDTSGTTLAAAASNISTLLATTGIASTPSGKTLQGQISTLQDSVSVWNTSGRTNWIKFMGDTTWCAFEFTIDNDSDYPYRLLYFSSTGVKYQKRVSENSSSVTIWEMSA